MSNNRPCPVFVGYRCVVDPEVVEKIYGEVEGQEFDHLQFTKLASRLVGIVMVAPTREAIFDSRQVPETGSLDVHAFDWLINLYPQAWPSNPADPRGVVFYGFDAKFFPRLLGMGALLAGRRVPLSLWHENHDCVDPRDVLVEAGVRDEIPLQVLCELAPKGPIALPPEYEPHADPARDAKLVAELVGRYQLLPSVDSYASAVEEFLLEEPEAEQPDKELFDRPEGGPVIAEPEPEPKPEEPTEETAEEPTEPEPEEPAEAKAKPSRKKKAGK